MNGMQGFRVVVECACTYLVQIVFTLFGIVYRWLVAVVYEMSCCDQAVSTCIAKTKTISITSMEYKVTYLVRF